MKISLQSSEQIYSSLTYCNPNTLCSPVYLGYQAFNQFRVCKRRQAFNLVYCTLISNPFIIINFCILYAKKYIGLHDCQITEESVCIDRFKNRFEVEIYIMDSINIRLDNVKPNHVSRTLWQLCSWPSHRSKNWQNSVDIVRNRLYGVFGMFCKSCFFLQKMSSITNEVGLHMLWTVSDINQNIWITTKSFFRNSSHYSEFTLAFLFNNFITLDQAFILSCHVWMSRIFGYAGTDKARGRRCKMRVCDLSSVS